MAKIRLVGRGMMFNADSTPGSFTSFEECSLSWDTQTLELPDDSAFSASSFDITLGKKATLTYAFHSFDANMWALITGGTTTDSLSVHWVEGEAQEVVAVTFICTVANNPLLEDAGATQSVARVYAKNADGDVTELTEVAAAAEVAGESYSVVAATGVFTFAAGDVGLTYYFDYGYTGTAGSRVRVGKDDLPAEFEFWGYVDASTLGGMKQHSIHITNIAPTMPDGWGASRLAHQPVTITAGVKGENIDWYFNT